MKVLGKVCWSPENGWTDDGPTRLMVRASEVRKGDYMQHGPNRGRTVHHSLIGNDGSVVLVFDSFGTQQVMRPNDPAGSSSVIGPGSVHM